MRDNAIGLLQSITEKMDLKAQDLKTQDERDLYAMVREVVQFAGTLAIDAVYKEEK